MDAAPTFVAPSCSVLLSIPFLKAFACACIGGDEDAQIRSIIDLLVRKNFIRRVDRMYKKPKPGKKRLAKWPKKLVPVRDRESQVKLCFRPSCLLCNLWC